MKWSLAAAAALYLGAAVNAVNGNDIASALLSGAGTVFLWTAWNQWRDR